MRVLLRLAKLQFVPYTACTHYEQGVEVVFDRSFRLLRAIEFLGVEESPMAALICSMQRAA